MGRLIDMERRGYQSSICDHGSDFRETMVGWVDVLCGDRVDFIHLRAIYIATVHSHIGVITLIKSKYKEIYRFFVLYTIRTQWINFRSSMRVIGMYFYGK